MIKSTRTTIQFLTQYDDHKTEVTICDYNKFEIFSIIKHRLEYAIKTILKFEYHQLFVIF